MKEVILRVTPMPDFIPVNKHNNVLLLPDGRYGKFYQEQDQEVLVRITGPKGIPSFERVPLVALRPVYVELLDPDTDAVLGRTTPRAWMRTGMEVGSDYSEAHEKAFQKAVKAFKKKYGFGIGDWVQEDKRSNTPYDGLLWGFSAPRGTDKPNDLQAHIGNPYEPIDVFNPHHDMESWGIEKMEENRLKHFAKHYTKGRYRFIEHEGVDYPERPVLTTLEQMQWYTQHLYKVWCPCCGSSTNYYD